jgi:hypothetical protein
VHAGRNHQDLGAKGRRELAGRLCKCSPCPTIRKTLKCGCP